MNESTNQDFRNKLAKNFNHLRKWARRGGIGAYRVYNKEIPNFPFAVDLYSEKDSLDSYAVVHQYTHFPDEGFKTSIVLESALEVLNVRECFLKERRRIRERTEQYGKLEESIRSKWIQVCEGELTFQINLTGYTDTGLFLDHRPLRTWLLKNANGKSVLNLYCYTGSLSSAAGKAGAKEVVSVDLSNTYLDWAIQNWDGNGLPQSGARFLREDCPRALDILKQEGASFDLVLFDPPSFSNSKKMDGTFDVQRDHVESLKSLLPLLAKGGQIFFSNNLDGFRLDKEQVQGLFKIEDSTSWTVPQDYKGTKPHQSWILRPRS